VNDVAGDPATDRGTTTAVIAVPATYDPGVGSASPGEVTHSDAFPRRPVSMLAEKRIGVFVPVAVTATL
jgi:hypothetical protein